MKLLVISVIPVLFLCYKFSIARSIEEYSLYRKNLQLTDVENIQMGGDINLQKRIKATGELLNTYLLDTLDNSKNLLSIVSRYCNDKPLRLKEYKPFSTNIVDSLPVLTRQVTVEGGFIDCLKLLNLLETKYKAGRISSVLFKSYTDSRNEHTYLDCTIYIQNILNTFYENK